MFGAWEPPPRVLDAEALVTQKQFQQFWKELFAQAIHTIDEKLTSFQQNRCGPTPLEEGAMKTVLAHQQFRNLRDQYPDLDDLLLRIHKWPMEIKTTLGMQVFIFNDVDQFPLFDAAILELAADRYNKRKQALRDYQTTLPQLSENPVVFHNDVCLAIFAPLKEKTLSKLKLVSKGFFTTAELTLKNRPKQCRLCNQTFDPTNQSECQGHLSPPLQLEQGKIILYVLVWKQSIL